MRQEVKAWLWLVPVLAIVAGGLIYLSSQVPVAGKKLAPDFTVKTLDGKTVSLKSFRGKPLFLNFWSSW